MRRGELLGAALGAVDRSFFTCLAVHCVIALEISVARPSSNDALYTLSSGRTPGLFVLDHMPDPASTLKKVGLCSAGHRHRAVVIVEPRADSRGKLNEESRNPP